MEWRIWAETHPIDAEQWGERVDALLDVLAETAGVEGPTGWGVGPTLGAVFIVEADDITGATLQGLQAFADALKQAAGDLDVAVRRFEVTEEDFEPVTLLGATDVARLLGMSRQRVYQLAERADFPRPVATLARGQMWERGQVEAWARKEGRTLAGRPRHRELEEIDRAILEVVAERTRYGNPAFPDVISNGLRSRGFPELWSEDLPELRRRLARLCEAGLLEEHPTPKGFVRDYLEPVYELTPEGGRAIA